MAALTGRARPPSVPVATCCRWRTFCAIAPLRGPARAARTVGGACASVGGWRLPWLPATATLLPRGVVPARAGRVGDCHAAFATHAASEQKSLTVGEGRLQIRNIFCARARLDSSAAAGGSGSGSGHGELEAPSGHV